MGVVDQEPVPMPHVTPESQRKLNRVIPVTGQLGCWACDPDAGKYIETPESVASYQYQLSRTYLRLFSHLSQNRTDVTMTSRKPLSQILQTLLVKNRIWL